MKTVISAKDIEELVRRGGDIESLPADAIYTPSARDLLRDLRKRGSVRLQPDQAGGVRLQPDQSGGVRLQPDQSGGVRLQPDQIGTSAPAAGAPASSFYNPSLSSKSPKSELDAFFRSAHAERVEEEICEVGRRLWQRAYVDGNGGNIAVRAGEDIAICTPTLVSKGFMKPADMCLVDFEGNQLAGAKKRTSEILMHLQIMQKQPRAVATVHCHPPYSTGFAIAGVEPPSCMIPEYEVFASVGVAPYRTPGTPEMGKLVSDLVDRHNIVLMANHGVVAWSHLSVEDAYFKMEILEAYCRTVLVAFQLGKPLNTFTPDQMRDLLKIKQSLDIPDPRHGLKEAELCDSGDWRPGVQCAVPPRQGPAPSALDPEAEALVQAITDQILLQFKRT